MDVEQPVNGPVTFEERLGVETAQPRFLMALFSLFAALGLALAMAGIYSVLSYLVSRRTREIGVRMALGARRADVLGLVFRSGGKVVGLGLVIGAVASIGLARLISGQMGLFQVSAFDPVSYLAVALLLGLVSAMACFVPARRAARVDPMEALRAE
jgi:ABC-type antimicrobial peptide transport system permease subunit